MAEWYLFLKCAAGLYVLWYLAVMIRRTIKNFSFVAFVWKRVRVRMVAETFGVLIAFISLMLLLMAFVPYMNMGWMNFVSSHGGNIMFAPVTELIRSDMRILRFAPALLLVLLFLVIPFIAKIEEEIFRYGHVTWPAISAQSVKFGLVHLIFGIPLAAGMSLIGVGFFLGYAYKKTYGETISACDGDAALANARALVTTIAYHAVFDSMLFAILFVWTIVIALA